MDPVGRQAEIDRIVLRCIMDLELGKDALEESCRAYPQYADELRQCVAAIREVSALLGMIRARRRAMPREEPGHGG